MPQQVVNGRWLHTCEVCGKACYWGFGRFWSCFDHRSEVQKMWVESGESPK